MNFRPTWRFRKQKPRLNMVLLIILPLPFWRLFFGDKPTHADDADDADADADDDDDADADDDADDDVDVPKDLVDQSFVITAKFEAFYPRS